MSEKSKLISEIKSAFKGVKLGNGIGLSEANAIDDYESQTVKDKCRSEDGKESWGNIPSPILNKFNCSPSYFDAEGMRFHMPAFIISELNGEYGFNFVSSLINLTDYSKSQFCLLTNDQKHSIESYLRYLLKDDEYDFEKEDIRYALDNYWIERPAHNKV